MRYHYKPIDEVRKDIIGLKVVDVEENGRVLYLEDEEGRNYCIDFTGEGGAVVHKGSTDKEELVTLRELFDLLLGKLDIDESEL